MWPEPPSITKSAKAPGSASVPARDLPAAPAATPPACPQPALLKVPNQPPRLPGSPLCQPLKPHDHPINRALSTCQPSETPAGGRKNSLTIRFAALCNWPLSAPPPSPLVAWDSLGRLISPPGIASDSLGQPQSKSQPIPAYLSPPQPISGEKAFSKCKQHVCSSQGGTLGRVRRNWAKFELKKFLPRQPRSFPHQNQQSTSCAAF
jgi:hypothetical protein